MTATPQLAIVTPIRRPVSIPDRARPAVQASQETIESDARWLIRQCDSILRDAQHVGTVKATPELPAAPVVKAVAAFDPTPVKNKPVFAPKAPVELDKISIERELGDVLVFWLSEAALDGLDIVRPDRFTSLRTLLNRAIAGAEQLAAWRRWDGFADDVASLARQCRQASTVRHERIQLGECPVVTNISGERCGAALVAKGARGIVTCRSCGTTKTVTEWTEFLLRSGAEKKVTLDQAIEEVRRRQGVIVPKTTMQRIQREAGLLSVGRRGKSDLFHLHDVLAAVEARRSAGERTAA